LFLSKGLEFVTPKPLPWRKPIVNNKNDIMQYEPKIWATADLLRGSGIKESEWPSYMMPFFALVMIESRLIRMLEELQAEIGKDAYGELGNEDLIDLIQSKDQGYNVYFIEQNKTLKDICLNDKAFEIDFAAYLNGFDGETKVLLGVDVGDGEKFLDINGVVTKLKAKRVLFSYVKAWSEIDLKLYNNSDITTLEEHIKRKWADMSAETAGEQYTPDDVIALIAEIVASKIEESEQLLKIYDCTCGGGNMLFGVEDRINEKFDRLTQTFGQDWNSALYALAKIESRFREDSKIEYGNTLTEDKFYDEEFDVVVANPPHGIDWKGYQKDIRNDKTGRFHYLPSVSDGQLLFMQHLISKLHPLGIGVVVSNGSALFSGDAGSSESNIRKLLFDMDIVEAIIQLPKDEFFNTDIYTYLWVLNKKKKTNRKNKVITINASEMYSLLQKNKGKKRKEIDEPNRLEIVKILSRFEDHEFARVFEKEFFFYNKQAIQLTNLDVNGKCFLAEEEEKKRIQKLNPVRLSNGEREISEFEITEFVPNLYDNLKEFFDEDLKPWVKSLDYKDHRFYVHPKSGRYSYDEEKETLIIDSKGKRNELGCGKIIVKPSYKKATKSHPFQIVINVMLAPDYEKDFEIIPFHRDENENRKAIEAFMKKYIHKPFIYKDNVAGVEINFNKIFYEPEKIGKVASILEDIAQLEDDHKSLEKVLGL